MNILLYYDLAGIFVRSLCQQQGVQSPVNAGLDDAETHLSHSLCSSAVTSRFLV